MKQMTGFVHVLMDRTHSAGLLCLYDKQAAEECDLLAEVAEKSGKTRRGINKNSFGDLFLTYEWTSICAPYFESFSYFRVGFKRTQVSRDCNRYTRSVHWDHTEISRRVLTEEICWRRLWRPVEVVGRKDHFTAFIFHHSIELIHPKEQWDQSVKDIGTHRLPLSGKEVVQLYTENNSSPSGGDNAQMSPIDLFTSKVHQTTEKRKVGLLLHNKRLDIFSTAKYTQRDSAFVKFNIRLSYLFTAEKGLGVKMIVDTKRRLAEVSLEQVDLLRSSSILSNSVCWVPSRILQQRHKLKTSRNLR